MKICIMIGALKNAGDYLISHRSELLLRNFFPDAQYIKVVRNYPISNIDEINSCDVIVFAGGPSYQRDIYPKSWPLAENLDALRPKLFMMGMGWDGYNNHPSVIYKYAFEKSTHEFLQRAQRDSHILGCRDFYSVRVLKNNSLKGTMTGCPAWYDLNFINQTTFSQKPNLNSPKLICVSDPARARLYHHQTVDVLKYLQKTFPDSTIKFIFHRGYEKDEFTSEIAAGSSFALKTQVEQMGIETHSIAFSDEGFKIYDDCDLHVGYRVHSHIYNLSRRKLSILINEDCRGSGVSEALGLWSISAFDKAMDPMSSLVKKAVHQYLSPNKTNRHIAFIIDDYISFLETDQYHQYQMAFLHMNHYYEEMSSHILSIHDMVR